MKIQILGLVLLISLLTVDLSQAQLKEDLGNPYDITGQVLKTEYQQSNNDLFDSMDMKMLHSYEASFGSFGGNYYNQNIYTNTTLYRLTNDLTGRLDLAFSHSPFGGNNNAFNQGGPQFFVRNAELNYQISEDAHISIRYQQLPAGSVGYNSFNGYGYSRYNPFQAPAAGQYWNN